MVANSVGLFGKEVAHLWKHGKKKSNSAVMCPCISYRHFAEVQPDFDWPLVPKAPDPEFEVTCWFYLLVFIWWLCYVPAVWTRGRHNY